MNNKTETTEESNEVKDEFLVIEDTNAIKAWRIIKWVIFRVGNVVLDESVLEIMKHFIGL